MPRKRNKENQGFPARWVWDHNAIYFQVPPNCRHQWDGKRKFLLGKTPAEAYKTWAERIDIKLDGRYINDLIDRYIWELLPSHKIRTQDSYLSYVPRIRKAFGEMLVADSNQEPILQPHQVYKYVSKRSSRKLGIKEVKFLSSILSAAVHWGDIKRNPLKGQIVFKNAGSSSHRYVEDWELEECYSIKSPREKRKNFVSVAQAYLKIKLLIGLRKIDMLRIEERNIQEDGIHIETSKNGKRVIFEWTPRLREAVAEAREARPIHISPWLFCTRTGASYVKDNDKMSGFDSNWQRFRKRVINETDVELSFTEHDIRGKTGSDSKSDQAAQELLTHSNIKTTQKHYRRKPKIVVPLG